MTHRLAWLHKITDTEIPLSIISAAFHVAILASRWLFPCLRCCNSPHLSMKKTGRRATREHVNRDSAIVSVRTLHHITLSFSLLFSIFISPFFLTLWQMGSTVPKHRGPDCRLEDTTSLQAPETRRFLVRESILVNVLGFWDTYCARSDVLHLAMDGHLPRPGFTNGIKRGQGRRSVPGGNKCFNGKASGCFKDAYHGASENQER